MKNCIWKEHKYKRIPVYAWSTNVYLQWTKYKCTIYRRSIKIRTKENMEKTKIKVRLSGKGDCNLTAHGPKCNASWGCVNAARIRLGCGYATLHWSSPLKRSAKDIETGSNWKEALQCNVSVSFHVGFAWKHWPKIPGWLFISSSSSSSRFLVSWFPRKEKACMIFSCEQLALHSEKLWLQEWNGSFCLQQCSTPNTELSEPCQHSHPVVFKAQEMKYTEVGQSISTLTKAER